MVLVVVDAHRLLVDVRLERVVVVGQRRDFVRHRWTSRDLEGPAFYHPARATRLRAADDPSEPVLPPDREAAPRGRRGAVPQAARARRPGPPAGHRAVVVAARRLARAPERG